MFAELRFEPLGALASEILGAIRVRRVPIFERRLDYILESEPPDKVKKALFEIVEHAMAQQEFFKHCDDILSRYEFPEDETVRQTFARMAAEGDVEAEMLLPFIGEVAIDRSETIAVADFAKRVGNSDPTL